MRNFTEELLINSTEESSGQGDNGSDWSVMGLALGLTLSLVTATENLLILIVIGRSRHLHTRSNLLICSLATADMLIGSVSMNVYTWYSVLGYFPLGWLACRLYVWVDFTAWSASLASLATIMLDRYLSINLSEYRHSGKLPVILMLLYVWGVSGLVWLWGVIEYKPRKGQCHFQPTNRLHMIVSAILTVYSPLIIITGLSCAIARVVRLHANRARTRLALQQSASETPERSSPNVRKQSVLYTPKKRQIVSRERKAMRLLIAFVVTYYACIFPYYITYIFLAVEPKSVPDLLLKFSYWTGYLNSTINPILYNIFNDDFRRSFIPALKCKPMDSASFNEPPAVGGLARLGIRSRSYYGGTHQPSASVMLPSRSPGAGGGGGGGGSERNVNYSPGPGGMINLTVPKWSPTLRRHTSPHLLPLPPGSPQ